MRSACRRQKRVAYATQTHLPRTLPPHRETITRTMATVGMTRPAAARVSCNRQTRRVVVTRASNAKQGKTQVGAPPLSLFRPPSKTGSAHEADTRARATLSSPPFAPSPPGNPGVSQSLRPQRRHDRSGCRVLRREDPSPGRGDPPQAQEEGESDASASLDRGVGGSSISFSSRLERRWFCFQSRRLTLPLCLSSLSLSHTHRSARTTPRPRSASSD